MKRLISGVVLLALFPLITLAAEDVHLSVAVPQNACGDNYWAEITGSVEDDSQSNTYTVQLDGATLQVEEAHFVRESPRYLTSFSVRPTPYVLVGQHTVTLTLRTSGGVVVDSVSKTFTVPECAPPPVPVASPAVEPTIVDNPPQQPILVVQESATTTAQNEAISSQNQQIIALLLQIIQLLQAKLALLQAQATVTP